MKVRDIREHFLSRADRVNRDNTVDTVLAGDPELDATQCAVTWMPGMKALQAVAEKDLKLLICHEPMFTKRHDGTPEEGPRLARKVSFIEEHGITVLRNHDCWDRWPGIGIPWAWGKFLGLGAQPAVISQNKYQHGYDIAPVTAYEFACEVAARCKPIGEQLVQFTGNRHQEVSRIGVGTGCGCDIDLFVEMGCDCSIVCDDGSCYWAGIQKAIDLGHPVIRVNHGTSEEPGMVSMTKYINDNINGLSAVHLPHGCTFQLVG